MKDECWKNTIPIFVVRGNIGVLSVCLSERAYTATRILIERGLVYEITEHSGSHNEHAEYLCSRIVGDKVDLSNLLSSPAESDAGQEIVLKFTLSGRDLARKYANLFLWSGLWWAEYRRHWVWVILAYVFGLLSACFKPYIMPSHTAIPEKVPHMSRQAADPGAVLEESARVGQDSPMQRQSGKGGEREQPSD